MQIYPICIAGYYTFNLIKKTDVFLQLSLLINNGTFQA